MNRLLDFKSFFKFLGRNKAYTFIDVFGLSVSLMFVLLIALYTTQELSTDKQHTKADRIYLVGNDNFLATGAAIPYMIKERYPEVEKVCPAVLDQAGNAVVRYKDRTLTGDIAFVDSSFFDLFDFRLVQGERRRALEAMNNAVVSETFARKMFGTDNPIGQPLVLADTLTVVVSGVMEDITRSSFPDIEVMIRWENVQIWNPSLAPDELGNAGSTLCFVLAREGSDFPSRADDMTAWFEEFFWVFKIDVAKETVIMPFSEHYFSEQVGIYTPLRHGDWKFVMVLMSVGILILIFAVTNYINLTVAQAGFRAREMAMRRLLGSQRSELFTRLMLESTLLTLLSFAAGLLLANAALPYANDLLQTKLDMGALLSPAWIGAMVALVVVVGSVSGLLPATVISSAQPIEVVRGTLRTRVKMVFSKVFITFQNVITITMIAISIVMVWQIIHMLKAPVGYRTENLVALATYDQSDWQGLMGELRRLPCVKEIGRTKGMPLIGSNNWTSQYEDHPISFQQFIMDRESFDMLGLEILRDNHLTTNGWYLSEQALREMNLPEDAASFTLKGEDPIAIAGIIRDVYAWGNITTTLTPIMFRFIRDNEQPQALLIQTQGDPFAAKRAIDETYARVTGLESESYLMDGALRETFNAQIRLAKIVVVFSAIAILISFLGLVAMSTYFIQQRSQEVAIRKVFGSSDRQILAKLTRSFLLYVGVAFVIAVPIIIYFARGWLSDYAYRIPLSPLIFLAAGLFCLLVSFAAVFFQSYRAATQNPVDTFRKRMN